jgi:hypothetical protein
VLEADREGFGLEAAAETGQLAVAADDALAWDQDRQRVGSECGVAVRRWGHSGPHCSTLKAGLRGLRGTGR